MRAMSFVLRLLPAPFHCIEEADVGQSALFVERGETGEAPGAADADVRRGGGGGRREEGAGGAGVTWTRRPSSRSRTKELLRSREEGAAGTSATRKDLPSAPPLTAKRTAGAERPGAVRGSSWAPGRPEMRLESLDETYLTPPEPLKSRRNSSPSSPCSCWWIRAAPGPLSSSCAANTAAALRSSLEASVPSQT